MPLVSTFGNLSARAFGLGAYRAATAFSPSSLFAAGEQGVWYDPSDLTTMFENSAGTTAVHTPGNGVADSPVGLLLDKRLGLVSSTKGGVAQQVAGQYFSTPFKSISSTTLDIKARFQGFTSQMAPAMFVQDSGGTARNFTFGVDSTNKIYLWWWQSDGQLRTSNSTVAASVTVGTTYWFRATLTINNSTQVHTSTFYFNADTGSNTEPSSWTQLGSVVTQGGFNSSIRTATCPTWIGCNFDTSTNLMNGKVYFASASDTVGGSAVQTFTPTSYTSGSTFTSTSSDVWTINGTARIVPDGNHATQSTSTARPTLSARYNLFTYSEQFNNAYWVKVSVSITADSIVAPDGTTTADSMLETAVTDRHGLGPTAAITLSTTQNTTFTWHAKDLGRRYVYLFSTGDTTPTKTNFIWAIADLVNGTITDSGSGGNGSLSSTSITALSNGWYRITMVGIPSSTTSAQYIGAWGSNVSTRAAATLVQGSPSYLGDITKGIYLWGADLRPANDGVGLPVYQRIADANTYDSVGFPYYIKTDGVDDFLTVSAINFSGTNKMSAFAGARKTSANTISCLLELTADFAATNGGFGIFAPNNTNQYETESRGTAYQVAGTTSSAYASPVTNVIGGLGDISAPSITLRLNGSQISTNTSSQGTGNYASAAFFMFRRNGANYAFGGRAYGIIVRGASSTSTEISNTETWLNGKTKAY